GGDERNRVKDKGSLAPGVPEVFGPAPPIQPVELPASASAPSLRPEIRATVLKEQLDSVAKAETERAAARDPAGRRLAEARLAAACAGLSSVQARLAADEAKVRAVPGADLAAAALTAEREAACKSAEALVLAARQAVANADAKTRDAAAKQLTAAQAQLEKARAALKAPAGAYTPVGPSYPRTSTGRRKALAEWITSPANPLTARVAVNHVWMRHFHAPLVATVYDFGRNGARPTHPEL